MLSLSLKPLTTTSERFIVLLTESLPSCLHNKMSQASFHDAQGGKARASWNDAPPAQSSTLSAMCQLETQLRSFTLRNCSLSVFGLDRAGRSFRPVESHHITPYSFSSHSSAWKAENLPLIYIRLLLRRGRQRDLTQCHTDNNHLEQFQ